MRKIINHWPVYSEECRQDVDDLLRNGGSLSAYRANKSFGLEPKEGSHAYRLEREIEKAFKVKYAVAVNSGTAALHCGLAALDLNGREVVTSPYSFSATVSAILLAGGIPRFADVDPETFCITAETVKPHITKRTAAILPVDLFGYIADYKALESLGIPLVEDACQAVGAWREKYAGTFGKFGAMSFNGGKNIPAGEAGALITDDPKIAERARLLMNHAENFESPTIGYNYRPNEVTCCIARHGLMNVKARNSTRQMMADVLESILDGTPNLVLPRWGITDHVFYVWPFKVLKNRERFAKNMKKRGVSVGQGYITPTLNDYRAFKKYATKRLPVVEELSYKTLCLLDCITSSLPFKDVEYIANAIKESL